MAKERAQARRDALARTRAEQKRKERRFAFLMWGIGALVIVVLIGLVSFYVVKDRSQKSLAGVRSYTYKGSDHAWTKVDYKETPPVGGQHNYYWQNCGIYDKPIHNEHGVHALEHGAVWITYRPDLPTADVAELRNLANAPYMLLSPYPGLPAPVVVSSWDHQLTLTGAGDPRLPEYIKKYKQNPAYTPEFGASCTGGVSTTADQPLPPEPSAPPATAMPTAPAAAGSSAPPRAAEPTAPPTDVVSQSPVPVSPSPAAS